MNKLDFSDINRFLVSLGIIFYVFAFSIPWLFLKDNLKKQITQNDYELLTDTSRELLDQNQEYLLIISKATPWISFILLILGSLSIFIGLIRWFKKQSKIDEREDIELDELRRNIPTLNKNESIQKAKEEVKSDLSMVEKRTIKDEDTEKKSSSEVTTLNWQSLIDVETVFINKIKQDNPFDYELKQNVRLQDGRVADIVLQSYLKNRKDILIEIKYLQREIVFKSLVGSLANMRQFTISYIQRYKKQMIGYFFLVIEDSLETEERIERLKITLNKYKSENDLSHIDVRFYRKSELERVDLNFLYK